MIEKASAGDIDEIAKLYGRVCDSLAGGVNYPGWKKADYPTRETAEAGLREDALFIARQGGRTAGSFILRHEPEPGYALADWGVELDYGKIFVIYTFCVDPELQGRGLGREMLEFIAEYSAAAGMLAVRLDVYERNAPAIALYKKCGFRYTATVDLGYGEYGLDNFELYQKLL